MKDQIDISLGKLVPFSNSSYLLWVAIQSRKVTRVRELVPHLLSGEVEQDLPSTYVQPRRRVLHA